MNYILYFFTYSFLGWLAECIYCGVPAKKFINRGFLTGPYCPIYGLGALIVILTMKPFANSMLLVFLAAMILTSALEYVTSYLMETLFHTKWWDYSKQFCNINGRICLKNSLLFGIMGVAVYYFIHPFIAICIRDVPLLTKQILATLFTFAFIYDMVTTVHALLRKNRQYRDMERCLKELVEEFKEFSLFPLTQPLADKIQLILDRTDADERLLEHIHHLKDMFDQTATTKKKFIMKRLHNAFPHQSEAPMKQELAALWESIKQREKGKDE